LTPLETIHTAVGAVKRAVGAVKRAVGAVKRAVGAVKRAQHMLSKEPCKCFEKKPTHVVKRTLHML